MAINLPVEPTSYTIASKDKKWIAAMNKEFSSFLKQGARTLVQPPSTGNTVGCKWLYKIKQKSDGSLERYKACLVAKGYRQQHGIDFDETFSPYSCKAPNNQDCSFCGAIL